MHALKISKSNVKVHILTEIVSAITVPGKPSGGSGGPVLPSRQGRPISEGLEDLLQDNLRYFLFKQISDRRF